jgi:hypothetical protein
MVNFTDSQTIEKTLPVSGSNKEEHLEVLLKSLLTMKQDINGVLTEQVEIEREKKTSQPNKRNGHDDEGDDYEEDDDIEDINEPDTKIMKPNS